MMIQCKVCLWETNSPAFFEKHYTTQHAQEDKTTFALYKDRPQPPTQSTDQWLVIRDNVVVRKASVFGVTFADKAVYIGSGKYEPGINIYFDKKLTTSHTYAVSEDQYHRIIKDLSGIVIQK